MSRRNLKWDVVAPPVAFPKAVNESDQTARRLFSNVTSEAIPSSSLTAIQHNTSLDNNINNLENTSAIHQNSGSSGSDDSLVAPSFQPLVLRRLEGGGGGNKNNISSVGNSSFGNSRVRVGSTGGGYKEEGNDKKQSADELSGDKDKVQAENVKDAMENAGSYLEKIGEEIALKYL